MRGENSVGKKHMLFLFEATQFHACFCVCLQALCSQFIHVTFLCEASGMHRSIDESSLRSTKVWQDSVVSQHLAPQMNRKCLCLLKQRTATANETNIACQRRSFLSIQFFFVQHRSRTLVLFRGEKKTRESRFHSFPRKSDVSKENDFLGNPDKCRKNGQ